MNLVAPIYDRISKKSLSIPNIINALMIDDDRFDRNRFRRLSLEVGLTIKLTEVATIPEMRECLDDNLYDIVFIDYRLNEGNGLEVLEEIQTHPINCDSATIMIAGEGQAEIAVTALKNGCSDYIVKDNLTPESLRRAIINALQKSSLQSSLNIEANMRTAFETVLSGLKNECIVEMRPMLSRMLMTVRKNMTPNAGNDSSSFRATMIELEESCLRLFSFLDDIENFKLK